MSRVLTYPPIVITRNQASVQNLVESTKLERISTDSKKAHRIEKKEKEKRKLKKNTKRDSHGSKLEGTTIDSKKAHRIEKKEKKEKRKQNKDGTKLEKSHKHSSRKADVNHHEHQFLPSKKVSDDSDQLEKSDLTEELEESQNHLGGYLSDGSQNSKKRNRDDSPPPVESLIKAAPVAGKPLRIRLIFKKPKEEVPALPRESLVCSTSVAKSISHQDVITSSISDSRISDPEKNMLSTYVAAIDETKKRKKHKRSREDRYNALIDNWTPSSICFADDSSLKNDDDDWLFGNKTREMLRPKAAVKIDEEDRKMRPGDSSWPRAQFLSEVGIYSLPYTVLF